MTEDDFQNALAQARGAQSVLLGLLITLERHGQAEVVKEAFDLSGETYTVASLSKDESVRQQAIRVLQVIVHMRQQAISHNPPRKTV